MRIEDFKQPVGFVYQEPKHPPSFQILAPGAGERLAQTSNIAEFAKAARGIPGIIWLTREQIAGMQGIFQGKDDMRPLTEEEERQLAA